MLERLYCFSMKQGSRILFGIALVLVIAGLFNALSYVSLGLDNQIDADWLAFVGQLLNTASYVIMPLSAAVLIDRLDRWLSAQAFDRPSRQTRDTEDS